jgi:uncharacterized protein (DUF362 family)
MAGLPNTALDSSVLLVRCDDYDPQKLSEIMHKGMEVFGYQPRGKVFVKPNVVFASKNGEFGTHAYTHNAVVESSLSTLATSPGVDRVDMGENTGIGVPTRLSFKHAGYYETVKKVKAATDKKVGIFCIDEEKRDNLFVGGVVHDRLRVSRKMARADSKVYLPKLKCHNITNMTGAVKLNVGICSDDERAIKHDFMLIDKIVDLLTVGYPDFIFMDAIEIGVANEAIPVPRKLGLMIMGVNPVAVDLVGARLLGYELEDVPYLQRAVERGYTPTSLTDVNLLGDIESLEALDEHAKCIHPYDDEYFRWQDIHKELDRLESPLRFVWGPSRHDDQSRCKYGCIMGLKMFLSFFEEFSGPEVFRQAKPSVLVIGANGETIDAKGEEVFLIGSCSGRAQLENAKKVHHIDKCFTTTSELNLIIGNRLGMKTPFLRASYLGDFVGNLTQASLMKMVKMRYLQDLRHFMGHGFMRKL